MSHSDFWTDDRVAKLKELALAKLTSTKIGEALGTSRNSVVSKCRLEGVALLSRKGVTTYAPKVRKPRAPKVARTHVKPPKPGPQNRPAVILGRTFIEGPESEISRAFFRRDGLTAVERVESGAGVVSVDAKPFALSHGCKWPLAGNMVCCNPISRKVYCEGHARVAYVGVMPRSMQGESFIAKCTRKERRDRVREMAMVLDMPPAPPVTVWDEARAA